MARDTPLAEAKAIAESQLDNENQAKLGAQAAVESSRAAVEQAELNLEFTKVTSLVDGIAGIAQVQMGNLVGPNSILTSVSQVEPIKAYFPISEQEYLHAQASKSGAISSGHAISFFGNSLELILADGSIYPHKGKILLADRQVDPNTGTIRIVAAFPNPGNILRPGQYGRVRVETSMKNGALLVPQSAVTQLQGSYQVAVVGSDNKVSMRTVKPGEKVGTMWVIDEGVKPGEQVVVEGLQRLRDGTAVDPKPRTAFRGRELSYVQVFHRRPIVAMVIAILTVIVGAVTIATLPVAQFPNIVPPEIRLQATYVGADAQTLEQSVATPIEQQMNGVDNMNYMYSLNATANSQTTLFVDFDVKTDPNTDLILTQSRENLAAAQLPPEVNNYGVTIKKSTHRSADAGRLVLAARHSRCEVPGQLRLHQPE